MAIRTVISASPQALGKCARVAKGIAGVLAAEFPDDEIGTIRLSDLDIHHCLGCNACREAGECFMEDGMATIDDALCRTDVLYVVSPVYFAGPPANFKAMIDRFQPHFWNDTRAKPKRQANLIVIGDGGDPYGFDPLSNIVRSGLAVVGFQVIHVNGFIGAPSDQIVADIGRDLFGREG